MAPRTAIAITLAAIMFAPAVMAQDLPLEVVNDTSFDLDEVYASLSGSGQWGDNLLGAGFLPQGNRAAVTISDEGQNCVFDLRFVLSGGDAIEEKAVDICSAGSYTLND